MEVDQKKLDDAEARLISMKEQIERLKRNHENQMERLIKKNRRLLVIVESLTDRLMEIPPFHGGPAGTLEE